MAGEQGPEVVMTAADRGGPTIASIPERLDKRRALRWNKSRHVPVAQLDRALASGAEGCRFKSCRAYFRKPMRDNEL